MYKTELINLNKNKIKKKKKKKLYIKIPMIINMFNCHYYLIIKYCILHIRLLYLYIHIPFHYPNILRDFFWL